MKIATTLPEKLTLIETANVAGRSLQVNKDGSLQYASFGTRVARALGAIGQSADWRLQQQGALAEKIKASLEQSAQAGSGVGAGKYDKLYQNVRLAGELSGPGRIVTEHYRAALERFDSKANLTTYVEPQAQTADANPTKTNFRPLTDVRVALVAHAETDRAIQSLGGAGRTLLGPYEDYRRLGEQAFPANREIRSQQAAELLTKLNVLEDRTDAALKSGSLTQEQLATATELLERIGGERSLIGAALANTNKLAEGRTVTWDDALALRRIGVDVSEGNLHPLDLDPDSVVLLGSGAMNEVFAVKDAAGDVLVYKPGKPIEPEFEAGVVRHAASHGADITAIGNRHAGADLRYEARNLVASNLDRAAGTSIVVESKLARLPVSKFTFKEEDVGARGDLHSDFGLVMKKVDGKTGLSLAGTPEFTPILESRALKRDLSTLVLHDAILQSFDRHPGNYMIETENGAYKGLKAIDNDFSLFATDLRPESFRQHSQSDRDVLNARIPSEVKQQMRGGYLAVGNPTWSLAELFDGHLDQVTNKNAPPAVVVTPEERARLAPAIEQFDRIKTTEKTANPLGFGGSPGIKQAAADFLSDVDALGFAPDSAVGKLAREAVAYQDLVDSADRRAAALRAKLEGEGIVFGAGSAWYDNPTHNAGLPDIADKAVADRVRSPEFERALVESSQHLLTRAELTALTDRLARVRTHLDGLEAKGRLVADPTWTTDIRDTEGRGIDDLVAEHGHSYWAILVDRHRDVQARNAAAAAAPAAAPAPAP